LISFLQQVIHPSLAENLTHDGLSPPFEFVCDSTWFPR